MYPSDEYMVYGNGVNNTCYTNPSGCSGTYAQTGWVYKSNVLEGQSSIYKTETRFLSSQDRNSSGVLYMFNGGYLFNNDSYKSYGVRPVVYLKSDIQIIDGDGTSGNPYNCNNYNAKKVI